MACCRRPTGISPRVHQQLKGKFNEVKGVFPGANVFCLVNPSGEVIIPTNIDNSKQSELVSVVQSVKKAAVQFGETLGQMECNVVHIKGRSHLFSCYDLDDNIFAFYSEMHAADIERFDTTDADAKLAPILQDIRLIVGPDAMSM